jgi:lysophospholipase L1-like esterase
MGQKSKRLLASFARLLLLASVILNFVLYNFSQRYYRDLNRTRLDPLNLSVYPQVDKMEIDTENLVVVFFGDSRAHDWIHPKIDGYHFVNRGIGAQTSAQVAARFNQHIKPLNPDIIILQVGINDLKAIPLFPGQKDAIVSQCKENIRQIISNSLNQGAIVVLTTIFPLGILPIERRLVWSDDVSKAIDEVNRFFYSLQGEGVIVFDTASILANDNGIVRREYSKDFLHLNDSGYLALNEGLVIVLQNIHY